MSSTPSCGQVLLNSPSNTFDYVLKLSDGKVGTVIHCHKCVLMAHSKVFQKEIYGQTFFHMDFTVLPGYLGVTVELIQYMYLKDINLIKSDMKKVKKCAGYLRMNVDFYAIACRDESIDPISTSSSSYNKIYLTIDNTQTDTIYLNETFLTKCIKSKPHQQKQIQITSVETLPKLKKNKRKIPLYLNTIRTRKRTRSNKIY